MFIRFSNRTDKEEKKENFDGSFDPMKDFFFQHTRTFIWILFTVGFLCSFYIIIFYPEDIFRGISLLFATIWAVFFLGYFRWAMFYYNINYGKSKKYWDNIFDIRNKKSKGEAVKEWDSDPPTKNPHQNETFGFPPGTVRGMIAFTLLFGAISLLIVSFGMEGELDESSFFWDHFEFFKTAFLMMIAFYFGYHSLKYLQGRFNRNIGRMDSNEGNEEELTVADEVTSNRSITRRITDSKIAPKMHDMIGNSATIAKRGIATSEDSESSLNLIPILDAGHGGLIDGKYTTGNKKKYTFVDPDGKEIFTICEGDINRKIGRKLMDLFDENNIPYKDLNVSSNEDMPLNERTDKANEIFSRNPNYYFLSIHSNSASKSLTGEGSKAKGFEIYTSVGQTQSDELATIAAKWYKYDFSEFRFRQEMEDNDPDKEANFAVLRNTKCPAFLVENLFFDNINEAKFLKSELGQNRIAECLYKIVYEIYNA